MYKLVTVYYFFKTRWFDNFDNRKKVEKYQTKMYKKQYQFLRKHSKFYKSGEIPYMDKQVMMDNFNDINTVNITKDDALNFAINNEKTREFDSKFKNITIGLSTGTSGNRGIFLVSNMEKAMWTGSILAKMLPKNKLLFHKVAFFMRADSPLYQSVKSPIMQFHFFDLMFDMEDNLQKLNELSPTILIAPPSCLYIISKAINENKIKINPIQVVSIAEVLEHDDKNYIKSAFNLDVVHQIYQCTEGFLGCTCQYGTIHLNEDIIKIEKDMIDDTRFYPIITDLRRKAQPVISYRLNDILCLSNEICPCGSSFTAIEKIEGRSDDIFKFKSLNSNDDYILIFPDFIRNIMSFAQDDFNYRIVQKDYDTIYIYLDNIKDNVINSIQSEFVKFCDNKKISCPTLEFFPYEYDIKKKLKRVESNIK